METSRGMANHPRQARRAHTKRAADVLGPENPGTATVTVHVPFDLRPRRGGKMLVVLEGTRPIPGKFAQPPQPTSTDVTAAVRALARAFRWRKLLETGVIDTVHEIAATEHINPSYVSRVLRLTLLAPRIVEAVISGLEGSDAARFERLLQPFPSYWGGQMSLGD